MHFCLKRHDSLVKGAGHFRIRVQSLGALEGDCPHRSHGQEMQCQEHSLSWCHGPFLNCYLQRKSNPHKQFYFVKNINSLVDILETQASLVAQLVKILPAMHETTI